MSRLQVIASGSNPLPKHGFHLQDGDARLPDNLRIVTLPACSPELNPVEGLWIS
jgi:transposase